MENVSGEFSGHFWRGSANYGLMHQCIECKTPRLYGNPSYYLNGVITQSRDRIIEASAVPRR